MSLTVCLLLASASGTANGTVTYATADEAYLDVGQDDGLAAGEKLKATRRKRAAGVCEVVEVSAHGARCKAPQLRSGDRVAFTPLAATATSPEKPAPTPSKRAPLPSEADLEADRDFVSSAPLDKIPSKKSPAWLPQASVTLRQQIWAVSTAPDAVLGRTTLDASTHTGLGFAALAFDGQVRVIGDLIAPSVQRKVDLYLFGAAVGTNEGPVIGQLGRFRPKKAPGAQLLDGVQLGTRLFGDSTEVGVFAGAIPDLVSTSLSLDRLTGGAYAGVDVAVAPGVLVLPRARAAVLSTPDGKAVRGELEAETQLAWRGVGTLGASLLTSAQSAAVIGGPASSVLLSVDGARVDADVTVVPGLTIDGGYRHVGVPAVDFDASDGLDPVAGADQATAGVDWRVAPWLTLGVLSGAAFDVAGTARGWLGPEVGLPQAFGAAGGLDFGYLEELTGAAAGAPGAVTNGFPGRSAWLGATVMPVSPLRLLTRVSYFETQALGDSYREATLMILADAPLFPGLEVNARTWLQQALPAFDKEARSAPTVLVAEVAVTGSI